MSSLLSPEIVTVDSLTDRCDRCSAAARLTVTLTSGGETALVHVSTGAKPVTTVVTGTAGEDELESYAASLTSS